MKALGKGLLNFEETYYMDTYGRKQPMYDMDRDAFSLLVFGFTGEKAMEFKWNFIKAFNNMELELMKARAELIDPSNIPEALRQLALLMEGKPVQETAEERCILSFPTTVTKPKVKRRTLNKPRNLKTTAVGYQLTKMGLRPRKTTDYLVDIGYLERKVYKSPTPNSTRPTQNLKVPTEKGKDFFLAMHHGLYFQDAGFNLVRAEIAAGRIPEDCFINTAA